MDRHENRNISVLDNQEHVDRRAEDRADVPRVLHIQQPAVPAARPARLLDVPDPTDRAQLAERRPNGRRHPLVQRRLLRRLQVAVENETKNHQRFIN